MGQADLGCGQWGSDRTDRTLALGQTEQTDIDHPGPGCTDPSQTLGQTKLTRTLDNVETVRNCLWSKLSMRKKFLSKLKIVGDSWPWPNSLVIIFYVVHVFECIVASSKKGLVSGALFYGVHFGLIQKYLNIYDLSFWFKKLTSSPARTSKNDQNNEKNI